jgi:hypothetical protein
MAAPRLQQQQLVAQHPSAGRAAARALAAAAGCSSRQQLVRQRWRLQRLEVMAATRLQQLSAVLEVAARLTLLRSARHLMLSQQQQQQQQEELMRWKQRQDRVCSRQQGWHVSAQSSGM